MSKLIYRARPRANTHLEPEIGIWRPSIVQIITGPGAFNRAMQRVTFNGGRYQYEPSEEYKKLVMKTPIKKH